MEESVRTLSLARRPTPMEPLQRLSRSLGVELWVKRDDLTGFGLSGNKVRKLEYLLADALEQGADTVITTGGIQSNHARATAVAARRCGLRPLLLLRGEEPEVADGNLLLDRLLGAEVRWCSADDYRHRRDEIMAEWADEVRSAGASPYVVPEGGSNGLGALGFVAAAEEVLAQGPRFDAVFVAVGSGGTLAGLALGPDIGRLHGVAVCDDRATFVHIVEGIGAEAERWGLSLPPPGARWDVLEGYQGPGYGIATPAVWRDIERMARQEGLLLDPVYTGKAWHALCAEVAAQRVGGRVLFWHTGGTFGMFGRGHEL